MRFRWQIFSKDGENGYESEWEQFKAVAIKLAARDLVRNFERSSVDNIIAKVFNEMNSKQPPVVITLDDARKILANTNQ